MKIFAHTSYIGTTGYNNHARDFFRKLSDHCDLKIRNFTVGSTWSGFNSEPHNNEPYITDLDKKLLFQQTLFDANNKRDDHFMYMSPDKYWDHDLNIVLLETGHHYFYDEYSGPKIAFNVWESTEQPYDFFNKLKEFDEIWVPSKWQKECTVKQGIDESLVKVVPEGVDVSVFYPEVIENKLDDYNDSRFKFLLFGRWDYRKSTKEIIDTFLKTFDKDEPVDLIVSIDNPYGKDLDGFNSTEERLENYGFTDDRIKIKHFPSREDYISYLKTGHVFLSCARSEGWNLPLIEAMSCGTPCIYSECSAQMEFAEGKGLPVKIIGEKKADVNEYARFKMTPLPGNYYEPDFNHLSEVMRDSYVNYESHKKNAIEDAKIIHRDFNWDRIGEIGYETALSFYEKYNSSSYVKPEPDNNIYVTYINGPKVEIKGNKKLNYYVEFIDNDTNEIIHSSTIKNNMWTSCSRKYYTNWLIRVNGVVVDKFDLKDKTVLISLESKSLGDTIAWTPYIIDFKNKHNCNVVFSSFHNDWFEGLDEYKDITFVLPGSSVGCYVSYSIGWFRDDNGGWSRYDMYPNQVNLIPLQQTATDILGLDYVERNYGVNFKIGERPIKNKYVVFGPQATSGCKEWVYEQWVELSKLLKEKGYDVVILTQNPYHIDGTKNVFGESMDVVATYLHHAEFMIGLGSGLSWLNWSLDKFTYMINGFSEENHEFTKNIQKINNNLCIRCWNDPVHVFDAGDWDWCPVYKGTDRQHICQRSITAKQVFNKIEL